MKHHGTPFTSQSSEPEVPKSRSPEVPECSFSDPDKLMFSVIRGPACERSRLTGLRIAIALTLLVFCVNTSHAQLTFDIGNAEIAVRNSDQQNALSLSISASNLIFDSNLQLTHKYASVNTLGSLQSGSAWGYDGPWSFDALSGDLSAVKDTLGCSKYLISTPTTYFYIDLTDAKWGAGSNSTVYKLLFDWDGSSWDIYVRSPGTSGTWSSATSVTSGETYTYWDLIDNSFTGSYDRERTTHNRKTFHVDGSDNLLPLPSTNVTDATLDVNLWVKTDIAVPDGSDLAIESYDQGSPTYSNTTLSFDKYTGMTVFGELTTMDTRYYNEYVKFVSSRGTPAAGDWTGIHCDQADLLWLNCIMIQHAQTGLYIDDCSDVEGYDINVLTCSDDGMEVDGSDGVFQTTKCYTNGDNNLVVTASDVEFYHGLMYGSKYQSGIVVGQGSTARIHQMLVYNNGIHGMYISGDSRVIIDTCEIYSSGYLSGVNGYGVYGFYNDTLITVRHSKIHDQYIGLAMVSAEVNGYESATDPPAWSNADSLARNCIYDNDYNLYGYYSTYELARAYYDGSVPHYQGGESSIYDPVTLQGYFDYSTAWLQRDFWNGNTIFNVSNSTVNTTDALDADSAGCSFETRAPSAPPGAVWNASLLASCQTWEALTPDSLRNLLYAQRNTLTAENAAAAFRIVWRHCTTSEAETFFTQLTKQCSRSEVLYPAYRYLASAKMREGDWSAAAAALLAMTGHTERGNTGYTSAHAMAALAMHWSGATTAARTSLDSLLVAYPGNTDLITVDRLIGGSGLQASPKQSAADTPENGYELHPVSPNPFTASTTVRFTLPEAGNVTLTVHDISGREVGRIADGWHSAGTSHATFNRGDLPSGVYILRMTAANTLRTRIMHIVQ